MEKVTRKIACQCNCRAQLNEDGAFTISAHSRAEYAPGAVAGAMIDIPPKLAADVRKALAAALEAVHAELAHRVDRSAMLNATYDESRGPVNGSAVRVGGRK